MGTTGTTLRSDSFYFYVSVCDYNGLISICNWNRGRQRQRWQYFRAAEHRPETPSVRLGKNLDRRMSGSFKA
jgi:hypothetical protein